ncbi:aquaporin-8 isoform B [Alligator mississippiensis]|uniref:Aquaporin-8 isoform B n=1 Tax=Alligator mississippiensis TaxID=8496 RepID=A0A151NWP4_ALLMI|nr:aquaporin-8 isoform B [Alligator mississippiensis]
MAKTPLTLRLCNGAVKVAGGARRSSVQTLTGSGGQMDVDKSTLSTTRVKTGSDNAGHCVMLHIGSHLFLMVSRTTREQWIKAYTVMESHHDPGDSGPKALEAGLDLPGKRACVQAGVGFSGNPFPARRCDTEPGTRYLPRFCWHQYLGQSCTLQTSPMADAEFGGMSIKEVEIEGKHKPLQPHWYEVYVQPCIAELLGATLFIFIGCSSERSGGHFNPAVSLAAWLIGGLNIVLLLPYWVAQMCGGAIGAALAKAMTSGERYINATGGAFSTITSDEQIPAAIVGEIVMTLFLVLAVCMGAINEKTKTPLAPFCIGFTVTADILAGGAVSGACMNPARAFGPALVANYWDYHWLYWVGPMIASLIAGLLIRLLIGGREIRLFLK